MIRYALKCRDGHSFESWFQSASAYDALEVRGLLECAVCGSSDVDKAIMAPRVALGEADAAGAQPPAPMPEPSAPVPVASGLRPETEIGKAMVALRREIEKNSDYVGKSFSEEARKIHDGEAPVRSIYGEAKIEDAKSLVEDGINVMPLPFRTGPKSN